MAVSALSAGLRCRCPNCGEGPVFRGFLKFRDRCEACGADLTVADAGDGPAFFVMFAALIFIVPLAMFFEFGSARSGRLTSTSSVATPASICRTTSGVNCRCFGRPCAFTAPVSPGLRPTPMRTR